MGPPSSPIAASRGFRAFADAAFRARGGSSVHPGHGGCRGELARSCGSVGVFDQEDFEQIHHDFSTRKIGDSTEMTCFLKSCAETVKEIKARTQTADPP